MKPYASIQSALVQLKPVILNTFNSSDASKACNLSPSPPRLFSPLIDQSETHLLSSSNKPRVNRLRSDISFRESPIGGYGTWSWYWEEDSLPSSPVSAASALAAASCRSFLLAARLSSCLSRWKWLKTATDRTCQCQRLHWPTWNQGKASSTAVGFACQQNGVQEIQTAPLY